jgi:hypothetical protein
VLVSIAASPLLIKKQIDKIDKIINGRDLSASDFVAGVISSAGNQSSSQTQNNFVSGMIDMSEYSALSIACADGWQYSICKYNGNSFVERSPWYREKTTFDNQYSYRINLASVAAQNEYGIDEVLQQFTFSFRTSLADLDARVTDLENNHDSLVADVNELSGSIEGLDDDINLLNETIDVVATSSVAYDSNDLTIASRYINTSGVESSSGNFSHSPAIPIPGKTGALLTIKKSGTIATGLVVAFYTSDIISAANYIPDSGVSLTEVITEDNPLNVPVPSNATHFVFTCRNTNEFSAEFKWFASLKENEEKVSETNDSLKWLAKITAQSIPDKIIHTSIDDFGNELQDLIDNQASYASIWDSPYFGKIKAAHDATCSGLCITLNCFTETDTFSIVNLPEVGTWQQELQAVSHWLRFAFHAKENAAPSASITLLPDFNNFVTGVRKLVGNDGSFDKMVRLGNFAGTKAQLVELRNAENGYVGFLCGDAAATNSYYFDSDAREQVWEHGMYIDPETKLVFIKSFPRLDSAASYNTIRDVIEASTPLSTKCLEIFVHGTTNVGRMREIVKWAVNKGYINAFPSDIYK